MGPGSRRGRRAARSHGMQAVMQSCSKPTAYSSLYALCLLLYVATELLWLLWLLTYYALLTIWLGLHAVLDEALHVVLEANRLGARQEQREAPSQNASAGRGLSRMVCCRRVECWVWVGERGCEC